MRLGPVVALSLGIASVCCGQVAQIVYDPLQKAASSVGIHRESVTDASRQREIPVKVYLPAGQRPASVVLFSHGLGGSREGSAYLGEHWAARGYVAVFLQHVGSDESVWRDVPLAQRMRTLNAAANGRNFQDRVEDVRQVIDALERWNVDAAHSLYGRMNNERIGMSGHSFGAVTTQAVGGQSVPLFGARFSDDRIRCAVAMSPSEARAGSPEQAFGSVQIPWMLMTGTKDDSAIGNSDAASRRKVYPFLPASVDKFELVFSGAEHSAFSDRALPGDRERRNPNHHRVILAYSTAFFDTYLQNDAAAKTWLTGPEARALLQAGDQWQFELRK